MVFRSKLYFDIDSDQWPIVYRNEYNVHFLGLEKLHPFDAQKWGNVFRVSFYLMCIAFYFCARINKNYVGVCLLFF